MLILILSFWPGSSLFVPKASVCNPFLFSLNIKFHFQKKKTYTKVRPQKEDLHLEFEYFITYGIIVKYYHSQT